MLVSVVNVPAVDADTYSNIDGKTLVAVDSEHEYIFTYESDQEDLKYSAKMTQGSEEIYSGSVDPSFGSISGTMVLNVDFPTSAGNYDLVIEVMKRAPSSDDDEDEDEDEDDIGDWDEDEGEVIDTIRYSIDVVDPVTLTVTLSTSEDIDLSGFGVYFFIDGEKMEDSYTTFDLTMAGTAEVTYDWVAKPDGKGHTYWVEPSVDGIVVVEGLGEKHTFYFGDNDYTVYIALSITLVIVLAISIVWVYRKPIKNYGKPKSRR